MWLLIKNGRIIDPAQGIDKTADLLIENSKISKIGKIDSKKLEGEGKTINATGLVVTPGLIDAHVHMREPGQEHKETIHTAALAAAAGGFTTIVGMPNTAPAIDNRALVEYVVNKGRQTCVNVLTTGAATKANEGAEMAEIGDMVSAGAVAISDDAFPVQSADMMRMVMQYSSMFDVPVVAHCEDKTMTRDSAMNEGIMCTILGLRPWPRQAEEIMISRNIMLAEFTGCRLHIQHLTTAGGVELVRAAKGKGISVTAETCPQYFSLTDEALKGYDTSAKCCPPLRTQADVDAIKQGLADGTIDIIATDHAPHSLEEKEVELPYAPFGMIGLETALPLVITNLVKTNVLSLPEAIAKLTAAPAKLLKLESGTLTAGSAADVTVIDPEAAVKIDASRMKSQARNTPFDGAELTGKVMATIGGGEIVSQAESLKLA